MVNQLIGTGQREIKTKCLMYAYESINMHMFLSRCGLFWIEIFIYGLYVDGNKLHFNEYGALPLLVNFTIVTA